MFDVDEFLDGQRACIDGDQCPSGSSKEFERGYNAQYQIEQVAEHYPQLAKQMKKEIRK